MQLRYRALHLRFWLALAVLLPAILLGALAMRQGVRVDAPVRLSPP